MSRYDTIDENVLWSTLERLQKDLEKTFSEAVKTRKLSAFGSMAYPLRGMHWSAAFLGLTDLADIAAAGSAFVVQLQKSRYRWSVELTSALKSLLKRTKAFIGARPDEPSAGVFIDSQEAVLQGAELKRPVPTEDLIALFRRRQIDRDIVSACRQLSVGQDKSFSHAITIPSFAKRRHRSDRHLSLVYLDLEDQELDLNELTKVLDEAFGNSEILLHGPLAIPWKNYRSYKGKKPYYLLLDTVQESREWLDAKNISGKTVKALKETRKKESITSANRYIK